MEELLILSTSASWLATALIAAGFVIWGIYAHTAGRRNHSDS